VIHTKIYTLSHPITKEIRYVGLTTTSLKTRLNSHMYNIRYRECTTHRAKWLKSLDSFPIITLIDEIVSDQIEWWLEEYYIDQFKAWGFNLVNSTNGGPVPITKSGKHNPNYGNKYNSLLKTTKGPIVQLDLDGNYIRTATCTAEFEKYGLNTSNVCLCIQKKRSNHKGFQFIKAEDYNPDETYIHTPTKTQKRKIHQLDPTTLEIIATHNSVSDASRHLISTTNATSKIHDVCKGKRKSYRGFKWQYM
jgi:hypothetical protein